MFKIAFYHKLYYKHQRINSFVVTALSRDRAEFDTYIKM